MRKFALIFIAFICVLISNAQIDSKLDINGEYQTVVDVKDTTIDLYKKTKEWIISSYNNPKEVIVADEESKSIKISAIQQQTGSGSNSNPAFYYTLLFEFKDGKYRLTYNITKLYITGQYGATWTYDSYFKKGEVRPMNEAKVERIKGLVDALLNSHYNFLNKKSKAATDDW